MLQTGPPTLGDVDFKDRLAQSMSHRSVSIQQLATGLGVTYQAVKAVLDGSTKALTAANTARAARFLGVDLYWLATGEGDMQPDKKEEEMALSSEERDLILALRVMLPSDREEIVNTILSRARLQMAKLDAVIRRHEERQPAEIVHLPPPKRR